MANISDVAKKAGVSKTTVSRVINDFSPVNAATKQKVLQAMEELNYTPSVLAQGMRSQTTRSIGVLIPDFRNYWYAELLSYIEMEARANGYMTIICSTTEDPEREIEYIKDLIGRKVDGIILCWYKDTIEKAEFLKNAIKSVPFVLMDQSVKGLNASAVYTDGYNGIRKLTKALIAQGHRQIAMIVEDRQYTVHDRRFQGYCDALRECGKEIDQNLIVENEIGFKSGYEGAKKLLAQAQPTAIVTIDDLTAVGILEYLSDQNIRVPENISVTGFDNIPLSQYCSPRLTTIAQPIEKLAKTAMELIIKKIQNPRSRNREVVFEPEIIVRKSAPLNHTKDGS